MDEKQLSLFQIKLKGLLQSHQDFLLILILFAAFRLMMLLAFPVEALTSYGDFRHYYNVASLSTL